MEVDPVWDAESDWLTSINRLQPKRDSFDQLRVRDEFLRAADSRHTPRDLVKRRNILFGVVPVDAAQLLGDRVHGFSLRPSNTADQLRGPRRPLAIADLVSCIRLLGGTPIQKTGVAQNRVQFLAATEGPHLEVASLKELLPTPSLHSLPPAERQQVHRPVDDLHEGVLRPEVLHV